MADTVSHRPLEPHPHVHDRFCGHAAVPHEDHVDEAEGPGHHLAHTGHMHVHEVGCGHRAVPHEDHVDYVHGDHRHAGHHVHYDEH